MTDLHLIDLDQPRPGYRKFITSWLHLGDGPSYVVDVGPANTADDLIDAVRAAGATRLDFVLLTHIHLDHAGAAGHLAEAFPEAGIVCWPKAAPHLVDPARLWAGSRQVLGETAEIFGEPKPVPAGRIVHPDELAPHGLGWLHTPGHAPHHVSYLHGGMLYVGEAAGMTCPTTTGAPYMRPATPPRFFPDVALASIDRLAILDPLPTRAGLAHHGLHDDPAALLADARAQIPLWMDVVEALSAETGETAWSEDFQAAALPRLAAADPRFASFDDLDADLQVREHEYVRNTLEGMLGYLASRA